jgi:DNA primase
LVKKKGKLLYNYHRAKEEIRKNKFVIIVEGFMDVIALYKVDIKNVIATMGTAITSEQAQLIKKLSQNVILCFDGDEAGNKATLSCCEELMKLAITPRIIRLENNLDPDEYIKEKGIDKFNYHLQNPLSYIDYKLSVHKQNKNFNNSEDISQYIKSVIKELELINDNIISELIIKRVSDETGLSIESLKGMITKNNVIQKKEVKDMPKKPLLRQNKYEKAEQLLLFNMLRHKEVIKIYENNNGFMTTPTHRYLVSEIVAFYDKYNDINIADFIAYLGDKKELVEATGKISILDLPETYTTNEINDYINLLNEYTIEMEIARLSNIFKNEINPLVKAEIAKQITELKRRSDISNE